MPASYLKPVGFQPSERMVQTPAHAFPGFSILQEYFVLPQKFLFLDVLGWKEWTSRGTGSAFEIQFELSEPPFVPARLSKNSFVLHATPAVNLFPHEADPISLDHRKTHYPVRPSGDAEYYQVCSVEEVKGFVQGTSEERPYVPFDLFRPGGSSQPAYHLTRRPSPVYAGVDTYLSVPYAPQDGIPAQETLSLRLTCTNGSLPGRLKAGDVSIHAKGCPEYVTFKNLIPPTPGSPSPIGKNMLWRLLSHMSIGFQSLENVETLKSLLDLYTSSDQSDQAALANQKRIEGIKAVSSAPTDRLVSGAVMRGREITVSISEDHFSGAGDLFLFGCVLDTFFAHYASINSFTSLVIHETTGGAQIRWPARMGNRQLV
jgi:type VI secretion system protein ImpG